MDQGKFQNTKEERGGRFSNLKNSNNKDMEGWKWHGI
jgi:hypothetical protein